MPFSRLGFPLRVPGLSLAVHCLHGRALGIEGRTLLCFSQVSLPINNVGEVAMNVDVCRTGLNDLSPPIYLGDNVIITHKLIVLFLCLASGHDYTGGHYCACIPAIGCLSVSYVSIIPELGFLAPRCMLVS